MGPLLVVEIYGIKKVDVIFFLPIHSQPLSSALRPRGLIILVALAASLVIWCPFGFGQWNTLPEITVRKELRALLSYSLMALVFQFWKWLNPSIIIASTWKPINHGCISSITTALYPFKPVSDSSFLPLPISACLILPHCFFLILPIPL